MLFLGPCVVAGGSLAPPTRLAPSAELQQRKCLDKSAGAGAGEEVDEMRGALAAMERRAVRAEEMLAEVAKLQLRNGDGTPQMDASDCQDQPYVHGSKRAHGQKRVIVD